MTVEEKLAAAEAENATLKANQSQNQAYITQLQGEIRDLKVKATQVVQPTQQPSAQPTPRPATVVNKPYEEFQKRKWREAVIKETLALIPVKPEHSDIMREEVMTYCLANMTDETTTDKYVRAVFEMLYGRALLNPQHAIHTVQLINQVTQPQTVEGPTQTEPNPTVTRQAPTMQEFASQFPPSVAQAGEQTFNPSAPPPEVKKIGNVSDAMAILKEKL